MPRPPRGKRTVTAAGDVEVVAKNPNGDGSVYFEPPRVEKGGRERRGFWRATYRDNEGRLQRVSGPTRAKAEAKRDEKLTALATAPRVGSRFSQDTTVAELTD